MSITINDIREWLEEGKENGATHLIVCCDTYDWDDYPCFVMPNEDAKEIVNKKSGQPMVKVMEVYNLSKDWEKQLKTQFNFEY